MIVFFKNQKSLAEAIRVLIDDYWDLEISEDELILKLNKIRDNNKTLLYRNGEYATAIKQRLGVQRLRVLEKIIENPEKG